MAALEVDGRAVDELLRRPSSGWAGRWTTGRRLIERPRVGRGEPDFDVALRPRSLAEFVGQERMKEQLGLLIEGARARGEPVDHLLFSGPPGLGKTTLGADRGARDGRRVPADVGAGARPTERPGRDPHQPRGGRRLVRGRDPPDAADGRGGPVSGARGLQARRRARQGADGAEHPTGAAAVHSDRGDHASGSDHLAASRAVRVLATPGLLLGGRPWADRPTLGRDPGARGSTRRAPTRSPGDREARLGSRTGCSAASGTSPRSATMAPITGDVARAGLELFEVDEEGLDQLDHAVLRRGRREVRRAALLACRPSRRRVGEEPDTIEDVVRALPDAAWVPQANATGAGRHRAGAPPPGYQRARHAPALGAPSGVGRPVGR